MVEKSQTILDLIHHRLQPPVPTKYYMQPSPVYAHDNEETITFEHSTGTE